MEKSRRFSKSNPSTSLSSTDGDENTAYTEDNGSADDAVEPQTDAVQEQLDGFDTLSAQLKGQLDATPEGGCITVRIDVASELGSKVGLVSMRRSQDGTGTPIDAVGKVAL